MYSRYYFYKTVKRKHRQGIKSKIGSVFFSTVNNCEFHSPLCNQTYYFLPSILQPIISCNLKHGTLKTASNTHLQTQLQRVLYIIYMQHFCTKQYPIQSLLCFGQHIQIQDIHNLNTKGLLNSNLYECIEKASGIDRDNTINALYIQKFR